MAIVKKEARKRLMEKNGDIRVAAVTGRIVLEEAPSLLLSDGDRIPLAGGVGGMGIAAAYTAAEALVGVKVADLRAAVSLEAAS